MDQSTEGPAPAPIGGLPWPAALLLALAAAVAGSLFDLRVSHALGVLFASAYVLGALAAVTFTRRGGVFIPMFTPPPIMVAAAAIGVCADTGVHQGLGMIVLTITALVMPQFPVMAATTAATLFIGSVRLLRSRSPRTLRAPGPADR